jgi:uncharacterized protein
MSCAGRGWFALPAAAVQTSALAVLSGTAPPPSLKDLVPRIAPRAVFFIYAGQGAGGEDFNSELYEAAGAPKELWRIAEARHGGGFQARPREYEQRVIGFFDRALLGRLRSSPGVAFSAWPDIAAAPAGETGGS